MYFLYFILSLAITIYAFRKYCKPKDQYKNRKGFKKFTYILSILFFTYMLTCFWAWYIPKLNGWSQNVVDSSVKHLDNLQTELNDFQRNHQDA